MDWKKELNTLFPTVFSIGAFSIGTLVYLYAMGANHDTPTALNFVVLSYICFMGWHFETRRVKQ